MKKTLEKIFWVAVIFFIAYNVLCYVDILAHNLGDGAFASWNWWVKF